MKKLKSWLASGILALMGFSFFPSGIFCLFAAALFAPIPQWQSFLGSRLKKGMKIILTIALILLFYIFAPKAHEHDYRDATCTEPKTCTICNATEGEPVHSWSNATCLSPKTCTLCGEQFGSPSEHAWTKATCTSPKTCSVCGTQEGVLSEHAWNAATCTIPKTCSVCGIQEGGLAEHSWKAATCTSPKTCSVCGTEEGSTLNHSYSNGKCSSCGKEDPNYVYVEMVWIPTKGGDRYHRKSDCRGMESPEYVTKTEAISRGFTACGVCYK